MRCCLNSNTIKKRAIKVLKELNIDEMEVGKIQILKSEICDVTTSFIILNKFGTTLSDTGKKLKFYEVFHITDPNKNLMHTRKTYSETLFKEFLCENWSSTFS